MSAETKVLTLSIVGCGVVGRTLSRLWNDSSIFHIQDILNRSLESAELSRDFVRAGRAVRSCAEMESCDVLLIAVPDDQIEVVAERYAREFLRKFPKFAFHVSGTCSSSLLRKYFPEETKVASVHPVKSFASSEKACLTFKNTFCALEGDETAIDFLSPLFEAIGGQVFRLSEGNKTLYHSGLVIGCNFLVVLAEMAEQCLRLAQVDSRLAPSLLYPLMMETLENLRTLGPEKSLTGPIVRGDWEVVRKHLESFQEGAPEILPAYRALGFSCIALAERSGRLTPEAALKIAEVLS